MATKLTRDDLFERAAPGMGMNGVIYEDELPGLMKLAGIGSGDKPLDLLFTAVNPSLPAVWDFYRDASYAGAPESMQDPGQRDSGDGTVWRIIKRP